MVWLSRWGVFLFGYILTHTFELGYPVIVRHHSRVQSQHCQEIVACQYQYSLIHTVAADPSWRPSEIYKMPADRLRSLVNLPASADQNPSLMQEGSKLCFKQCLTLEAQP